jgi:hypothetical protein
MRNVPTRSLTFSEKHELWGFFTVHPSVINIFNVHDEYTLVTLVLQFIAIDVELTYYQ